MRKSSFIVVQICLVVMVSSFAYASKDTLLTLQNQNAKIQINSDIIGQLGKHNTSKKVQFAQRNYTISSTIESFNSASKDTSSIHTPVTYIQTELGTVNMSEAGQDTPNDEISEEFNDLSNEIDILNSEIANVQNDALENYNLFISLDNEVKKLKKREKRLSNYTKNKFKTITATIEEHNNQLNTILANVTDKIKEHNNQLNTIFAHVTDKIEEHNNHLNTILANVTDKIEAHNNQLSTIFANLAANRQENDQSVKLLRQITDQRTVLFGAFLGIVVLIFTLVFYLFNKKIVAKKLFYVENKAASILSKTESLKEDIVEKLTINTEQISACCALLSATNNNIEHSSVQKEQDHSMVKALADRITFMEVTLHRMDPSIKGHRQLVKMLSQMKDNLLAYGYELIDMLGEKYDSGLNAQANFIEDPTLPEGTRIITGITKPQINYNGVMIQSAEITVSQNIV